jgi:hypothetical protein
MNWVSFSLRVAAPAPQPSLEQLKAQATAPDAEKT